MIKLDRNYSDYTDMTDSNYPNGKAMDCSTDESYDGTPILQSLVNDVKGALESVVYQAEGSLNKVSGNPDNIAASDFLNALKKLINTPDAAHAGLRGTDAHGATTSATAGQLMARDTNGRCQVSAPSVDADISTKKYVDDTASAVESNAKNLANATGTLAIAHGGTGNTSVDSAPTANSTKMCTSGGIQSAISTAESNAKNLANATGTLAIAHGGTGATTAAGVRNALGLGNTTGALPVANGGTGATDAATARTNLGLGNVRNEAYSVPVGFTYFQLPGEKAPSELFPNTYTWLDITAHFEGLFFRAAGGNAKAFDTCNYEVQTTNATTVTLKKTPTGLAVGDTVICYNTGDESKTKTRKIKAISSSTITFEDSISSASYTNVLIAQSESLKSHSHLLPVTNKTGNVEQVTIPKYGLYSAATWTQADAEITRQVIPTQSDGGVETRPQNTSIKIWKRTA